MSGQTDRNRETQGVEAPGAIDRALDRDRDDRMDLLEGNQDRQVGGTTTRAQGEYIEGQDREVRVPVVEEQLQVGKREVELGEIEIRKRVVEETRMVPVTVRREEVNVEQLRSPERPLQAGEQGFQEGPVRRPEVDVDEGYGRVRGDFQQHHAQFAGASGGTFEESEPHYLTGYQAGSDARYADRSFEEVEPELRRTYEAGGSDDGWERLRERVRTGFSRARGR